VTALLDDYVSGSLPRHRRRSFDVHLAECPGCRTYLSTYVETIRLARASLRKRGSEAPSDVPEDLVGSIVAAADESE
jgi:anti-sigma factor RsiW